MDDAQPMVLERDPKADSLTNVRPDQLLDFDSATVVAAALARLCPQAAAGSKSEADCLLRDTRKLYEGNMRYFRTLRGVKYSNKTQPKGRDSHRNHITYPKSLSPAEFPCKEYCATSTNTYLGLRCLFQGLW